MVIFNGVCFPKFSNINLYLLQEYFNFPFSSLNLDFHQLIQTPLNNQSSPIAKDIQINCILFKVLDKMIPFLLVYNYIFKFSYDLLTPLQIQSIFGIFCGFLFAFAFIKEYITRVILYLIYFECLEGQSSFHMIF